MTGLTRYGVTYGHDASTGRFQAIVAGDITHEQTYLPATNVPLAVNTTGPQASLSRAFDYDGIYRVRGVTNTVDSSTVVSSTAYRYDANNRRARSVREDGTYWEYGYDALGQVTGGRRYVIGGVEPDPLTDDPVPGLDYGYTFDTIGNRTATRTNSHDATWTPNDLNQYTGRAVPGFIDVLGLAHASAEVTVNDITADRTDPANWWHVELSADNSTDAVYEDITVTATIDRAPSADAVAEVSGSRFLPKTPEAFIHDDDGNMTSDGRWTYIWNSENRLVQMETTPAAVLAGVPRQRLTFAYDSQGRRWKKTVARDGVIERTHLFLYDDWNCIREVITEHKVSPEPDHTWARNYVWGLDLSGTMQGAGGVGGLLQVTSTTPTALPSPFSHATTETATSSPSSATTTPSPPPTTTAPSANNLEQMDCGRICARGGFRPSIRTLRRG